MGGAQMNLGTVLEALGKHEGSAVRLKEAVAAYRAALEERTREKVPIDWAMTQMNLGYALSALGERETGAAWFEEAVAAFDACLAVTAWIWPSGWVQAVEARRDTAQARLRRQPGQGCCSGAP
jgi:tetratricopeptide (TPR) repeat protein